MPEYYKYDLDKYPYIFQIAWGLFSSGQFQELIEEQLVDKEAEDELKELNAIKEHFKEQIVVVITFPISWMRNSNPIFKWI